MASKNAHCSFCGAQFAENLAWPRVCTACGNTSYLNPLPVAVALLPVDGGLLTVRRAIPPRLGELALPGGFIGMGESWYAAAARELWEETGISVDPGRVRYYESLSSPAGHLLLFGLCPPVRGADLPPFTANEEVSALVLLHEPAELAFPTHTQVARMFFERTDERWSAPSLSTSRNLPID